MTSDTPMSDPSPLQPLDWLDTPIRVERPTDLNVELQDAIEELVSATINLATPYGRLEPQPTTTNLGEQ